MIKPFSIKDMPSRKTIDCKCLRYFSSLRERKVQTYQLILQSYKDLKDDSPKI